MSKVSILEGKDLTSMSNATLLNLYEQVVKAKSQIEAGAGKPVYQHFAIKGDKLLVEKEVLSRMARKGLHL